MKTVRNSAKGIAKSIRKLVTSETLIAENGEKITFTLVRNAVQKRIYLKVKADSSVVVSAPLCVPVAEVFAFVGNNVGFVEKARERAKHSVNAEVRHEYLDGELFTVFGKQYSLRVRTGKDEVFCSGDELCVFIAKDSAKNREKLLSAWFDKSIKTFITEYCRKVYPSFEKYCNGFPEITFRRMKGRWGSCRAFKNSLTFNLNLIEKPPRCVGYVVLHEFVHFIHQNHSAAFYAELKKYVPDYAEIRKELNGKK